MKAPRRRITLKIEIGADSWEDAADALDSISQRIHMEGAITSLVSGGWSSGYTVIGMEDKTQTGDKFRSENEQYVASLKSPDNGYRKIPLDPQRSQRFK